MDILAGLIQEVQNPTQRVSPTHGAESAVRNSPKSNRRPDPIPELEGEPDEPIRFLRKHPFPDAVYRLAWGRGGVPDYVRFADGVYRQAGTISRPFYELVDSRPVPPWLRSCGPNDPHEPIDDLPNDNPCCFWCGRRLFYRTRGGLEYCALCDAIPPPPKFEPKGNFSNDVPSVTGDVDLSFDNVEFFLKPGNGFDTW